MLLGASPADPVFAGFWVADPGDATVLRMIRFELELALAKCIRAGSTGISSRPHIVLSIGALPYCAVAVSLCLVS